MDIEREQAFAALAAARTPALLRTAYLLTGDHHGAQDLVQVALARTYERWSRLSDTAAGEAYVILDTASGSTSPFVDLPATEDVTSIDLDPSGQHLLVDEAAAHEGFDCVGDGIGPTTCGGPPETGPSIVPGQLYRFETTTVGAVTVTRVTAGSVQAPVCWG